FASMAGRSVALPELAGLAIKSVGWTFFVGSLAFGTASLTANLALVTKVYFPRELLPVSATITQGVDSSIGGIALLILFPAYGLGHIAGAGWLVLVALLLLMLTVAVVLFAACANVYFRDVKHIVQLVTSFGIFFTPVFFDLEAFGARGARLFALNPLTGLLEGARLAVVTGHDLSQPLLGGTGAIAWSPTYLAYSAVCATVGLVLSSLLFRRASARFADFV
ncbi:MAG TPA: ABC transporter permease, partial [Gemmatimonas sp.]|nr:ABC transporter permease [Gemmatimonas sp.]